MAGKLPPSVHRRRKQPAVSRVLTRPMTADQERALADEYAAAMGWDLTPDDRAAAFKRSTEGARTVERVAGARRVG